MQLCQPIRAAWTLRRCFERSERVRTTAKVCDMSMLRLTNDKCVEAFQN